MRDGHATTTSMANPALAFTSTASTFATFTSDTSRPPDVFDDLIRAFTVLALAMREWKETL